ncbi:MAG: hypothetical protein HZA50_11215 [Planctomycetes bacterium]|nr:hypothetical protein [Planctomycetota bacterium]
MTVHYKPPSRMVGDLLGAALLFAGGLITFVGLFWASGWPVGGIILLLVVAFVVQFTATIITESRTTTTSIWTLSLIMPVWMLLWGVTNIVGTGESPSGWLLLVLSLPIYVLGVVGGKIGTKMYQQQETARITAARAAMDLVAPASGKGDAPTGSQNALDDDLDDQLSKRSEDTTIFSTKDFSKPVGAKPPAAGPGNSKPPVPKPPSPPPTKRLGL